MNNTDNIIDEPIHGRKFYTRDELIKLKERISIIYNELNIRNLDTSKKIISISDFLKNSVSYKKSYFDCYTGKTPYFEYKNIKYRTAYGALVIGEAICSGYAEAARILLSLYDIKSYTILSRLPVESKKLLHYVVVAECKCANNEYIIVDPESEQYCQRKGMSFAQYLENSVFLLPNSRFTDNILGKDGAGILADEYMSDQSVERVLGTKNIDILIKKYNIEKNKTIYKL